MMSAILSSLDVHPKAFNLIGADPDSLLGKISFLSEILPFFDAIVRHNLPEFFVSIKNHLEIFGIRQRITNRSCIGGLSVGNCFSQDVEHLRLRRPRVWLRTVFRLVILDTGLVSRCVSGTGPTGKSDCTCGGIARSVYFVFG